LSGFPPCHVTFTRTGLPAANPEPVTTVGVNFANDTFGAVPAVATEASSTEAAPSAMSKRFTCSPSPDGGTLTPVERLMYLDSYVTVLVHS
jgi:hypothetical protein